MSIEHDTDILFHYALGVLKKGGGVFPQEYIDQIKEVIRFKLSLKDETDRGCALMAASLLEHRITELLKKNLVADKDSVSLLSPSGPIGSFSNKIDLSFALGLIPNAMKRDLHLLRKIRNLFAHTTEVISFETPSIKDRCFELKYAGQNRLSMSPRTCFTQAMLGIDGSILVYRIQTNQKEAHEEEEFNKREEMFHYLNKIEF